VVSSVSGTVERAQGRAFRLKPLPLAYREPAILWLVLVDFGIRQVREKVGNAPYVVMVPVREKNFVDSDVLGRKERLDRGYPLGFTLAAIDEDARRAAANDVRVCTCIN